LARWFDTSCFVASPSFVFGSEGRNVLIGPGRNNLDLGLHRSFRIPLREAMRLDVRGEAFNGVRSAVALLFLARLRRG
jgi:hypothetical protein